MKKKSEIQLAFDDLLSQIRIYHIVSRPVFTPLDPKRYSQPQPPLGIHQTAERSRDVGGRKPPEFSPVSSAPISCPA